MSETAPNEWLKKMVQCDWCDEKVQEVSRPHAFEMIPGKVMCRSCWDLDRLECKSRYGEDIGPFRPIDAGQ
jgi:hypothetical protein